MSVEWARGIYDAVWSLAFALNSSINDSELNMNLTQVMPGSNTLAQTIANYMSRSISKEYLEGLTLTMRLDLTLLDK